MTEGQFVEWISDHNDTDVKIVACRTVEDRADLLQWYVDHGFTIGENTQRYLDDNFFDATYMHPGFSRYFDGICCYRKPDDKAARFEELDFLCAGIETGVSATDSDMDVLFS